VLTRVTLYIIIVSIRNSNNKLGVIKMLKTKISSYPEEAQKNILQTLKAYSKVYVIIRENEEAEVTTGLMLAPGLAPVKSFATIHQTDIYNLEERKANFKEVFGYEDRTIR
jgi:hypothetical protein